MKKEILLKYITNQNKNYSIDGYKRNSPDVDKPFNIIPSGNITMKGVDFPVEGTDNLGNKIIMQPGKDYKFPGNEVIEKPLKNKWEIMQDGGSPAYNIEGLANQLYEKNKDVPWVKRIMTGDTRSITDPNNPNQRSSHLMSSSDNYIFPMITDNNGTLEYITDWRKAFDIAKQKGDVIEMPNEEIANKIASGGYKTGKYWNNFINKYEKKQTGGNVNPPNTLYVDDVNDPKYKAYQDSLNLYKHFDAFQKYMEYLNNENSSNTNRPSKIKSEKGTPGKPLTEKEKKEHLRRINSLDGFHFRKDANYISPSGAIYYKYLKSNNYSDKPYTFKYPTYHKTIAPIRFTPISLHGDIIPEYKKPTQPVEVLSKLQKMPTLPGYIPQETTIPKLEQSQTQVKDINLYSAWENLSKEGKPVGQVWDNGWKDISLEDYIKLAPQSEKRMQAIKWNEFLNLDKEKPKLRQGGQVNKWSIVE